MRSATQRASGVPVSTPAAYSSTIPTTGSGMVYAPTASYTPKTISYSSNHSPTDSASYQRTYANYPAMYGYGSSSTPIPRTTSVPGQAPPDWSYAKASHSPESYVLDPEAAGARATPAYAEPRKSSQRRPSNRDEFDGPHQLLDRPPPVGQEAQESDLPRLPVTLHAQEQDEILARVNERLSRCAFDFIAKYQFPIPLEPDKRPVRVPADREWTEWVYLLKRLATKRRIPARVLYNGQIKQFITVLENSLEMRHAAKHQSRPLKDDRNVLQLISAGIQVTKILKDAAAMQYLDALYVQTEQLIQARAYSR
ncbi:hypothetical protein EV356DRAFT_170396 [Viridothelium virens]|uniref:Uncharacterized protein n=1 Tax=Viridothelium virens TaxID=1048519 RepID=A0A6A6HMF2_VIRVR|nr:hypothetical protein EV356DRAFT_170396 [Viridothelium virens]